MSHDAKIIANKFIELAEKSRNPLTPMQLLKLVYIAHGWMLGIYSRPLISDRVEAWKYGPVIPQLYHQLKSYRDQFVTEKIVCRDADDNLDEEEELVISEICNIYGKYSGIELSSLTHKEGTPWQKVYIEGVNPLRISNDIIEQHYKEMLEEE